jgi:hypothetical protein
MPLLVSSRPTVGLTISAPDRSNPPMFAFLSASSTCCAVALSEVPDSAPVDGTRIITRCAAGSPYDWTTVFWPPPG